MTDRRAPAVLIIFNRPDVTARAAEAVARAKPPRVFVFADGPRPDRPDEAGKCAATRAVIDRIEWPCEVLKKYSDTNLGCGLGVTTGIDWVFEHDDRAIIFEDDCVPHPSFFRYCDELLERYHDDERVMQIAGTNLQRGRKRGAASYFFSRFNTCWGWATWRRAWRHMDLAVKAWPEFRDTSWILDRVGDVPATAYLAGKLENAYRAAGTIDYFDYPWQFSTWLRDGLCIMPNVNMVTNIGFQQDATHTTWGGSKWANLPQVGMPFPMQHPANVTPDREADEYFVREVLSNDIPRPESMLAGAVKMTRRAYAAAIPKSARMFLRTLRCRS